jgi:hypothetical protein
MKPSFIQKLLLWAALALFVVCLFLPAVGTFTGPGAKPDRGKGYVYFLLGPLGPVEGQVGWFANPLMLFAALKASRISAALSVGLVSMTVVTLRTVPMIEPGNLPVVGLGTGYYLWLVSAVLILISTFIEPAKNA